MLSDAPSERPKSAARCEPTASMTARTSSIRVSSVGAPLTGSDMPVPRLSNLISRENDAISTKAAPKLGQLPGDSRCVTNPGTKTRSKGPSPMTW